MSDPKLDPRPWIATSTGFRTGTDWFNSQLPGSLRFDPSPGYSQNPADYGIEAPHE